MPIGDQEFNGMKATADELKQRYNDLIKEAIQKADPLLEVVRADEVSEPGSITTDIITRIMQSHLVVAAATYPNPNVFYELGLRHACRVGTVIIRDKNGPKPPFDIVTLRHIEYENTPTGLKALSEKLRVLFPIWRKTQKNLITIFWMLQNSLVTPSQDMGKMSTQKKTRRSK